MRAAPTLAEGFPDLSGMMVARRAHWGRWLAAAAILVVLAAIGRAFVNGQIEWTYVSRFLTAKVILEGITNTMVMAVLAMALGIVLGVVVAIMRLSSNPVLTSVAAGYTWLFRGTPLILQLLLWFNLALVFPTIGIPGLWSARAVDVMTPFLSALLGLGINQGAYTSEVMRAGMLSVDVGQYEAAQAIGMGRLRALRRIVLPQAMRVVIPPLGNEFIGMVKATSLASVIQYPEVLHNAENIYYANSRVIELLIVAGSWYLLVVSILTPLQMLARTTLRAWSIADHPMTQPLVAIRSVSKNFGEFQALNRVSLDVRAGEVLCLIGASGSGKTTLLRCINQLTSIDSGGIWLDGELLGVREEGGRLHRLTERQIARQRLKTGMVFQRFNLFPHKTALENITEGPVQVQGRKQRGRAGGGDGASRARWPCGESRCLSLTAFRRAAAAGGDCPRARHEADADAVRRADQCPRSRTGRRGAHRHEGTCSQRHDDDGGDARTRLRARGGRYGRLYGPWRDRGVRTCGGGSG